jgi:excisionase family DNA binding protein
VGVGVSGSGSQIVGGDAVWIGGRTCLVVAEALSSALRDRAAVGSLAREKGWGLQDVNDLRHAVAALYEAGLAASGETATAGCEVAASSAPMSTRAAAGLLGLSERTVRGFAMTKELPAIRVGRGYAFTRSDVLAFREARA